MRIETITHRLAGGWSRPLPADLDSPRTLVVTFGAAAYVETSEALAALAAAFPNSVHAGCSSAGEILGDVVADGSLVVVVIRFGRAALASATTPIATMTDSAAAGTRLGAELAPRRPRLVLVFSDGLAVNGIELVKGLAESLPPGTLIAGGLAGDGDRFARTWVLIDGKPQSGFVTAAAFSGPLPVGARSQGGWDAFGPGRRVTRATGNILFELDGQPALGLYKAYLGDLARGLPATALHFPLAIRENIDAGEPIVRTILAVDEAAQSMTFAGDVPTGWRARLMRSSSDRLIAGALRAAAQATTAIDGGPALALAISSVPTRRRRLRSRYYPRARTRSDSIRTAKSRPEGPRTANSTIRR